MTSVAINMFETDYFTKVQSIFSNGDYHSYNHHPSLFFFIHGFILQFAQTLEQKLLYSYSLALFSWMLGMLALFAFLRFYQISYISSILAIIALIFAKYTKAFSLLVTYDSISIFLSTSMFFAIFQYEKAPSRKNLVTLYIVSIFALLISWYVVFFIFVYGSWNIIRVFYKQDLKTLLKDNIFRYCFVTLFVTTSLMMLLFLQSLIIADFDLNDSINRLYRNAAPFDSRKNVERNILDVFVLFHKQLKYSFPLTNILLIYLSLFSISLIISRFSKNYKFYNFFKLQDKDFSKVAFVFLIAVVFFHILMYRWSNIHPFIFFWIMPILAISFAVILDEFRKKINSLQKKMIFDLVIIVIIFADLMSSVKSFQKQNIYDLYASNFIKEFIAISREKKSVIELVKKNPEDKHCQTPGLIYLLSSHPNRLFKDVMIDGYQHIVIECKENGSLTVIKNLTTGEYKNIKK